MLDKPDFARLLGEGRNDILLDVRGNDSPDGITIPHDDYLFSADFDRDGSDLVITGTDGRVVILEGYFANPEAADLVTNDGAVLKGDIVEVLAGPANPGAYAQQGNAAGGTPIGQVETLTGSATVQRADGTVEPLLVGTKVFQNDVVQTTEGSTLSITFADKTIFTLASNSRMVLSELVYSPDATDNSAVFNLVQGSFVFVAGQVAKTGDMTVDTPAATMGIRGTTVSVILETNPAGQIVVRVALNQDITGETGTIQLINKLSGEVTQITTINSTYEIDPANVQTVVLERTAADQASDLVIVNEAFQAIRAQQAREAAGEDPVNNDDAGDDAAPDDTNDDQDQDDGDNPDDAGDNGDQQGDNTDAGDGADDGSGDDTTGDGTGDDTTGDGTTGDGTTGDGSTGDGSGDGSTGNDGTGDATPGDQGSNSTGGSGLDSSAPTDVASIDGTSTQGTTISDLGSSAPAPSTPTTPTSSAPIVNTPPPDTSTDDPVVVDPDPDPTPIVPVIVLPVLDADIEEDTSVALTGFDIQSTSGGNDELNVTLTAGSTIRLAPGADVVIDPILSVESELFPPGSGEYDVLVISGTVAQVNAALNTATYTPSPDDDDGGTLTIEVTEVSSGQSATSTLNVGITPVNDAPVARADAIVTNETNNTFVGDLLANDFDVDTGDFVSFVSIIDNDQSGTSVTPGQPYQLQNGGLIIINSDGTYTFDPGTAYEDLNDGESRTHTFTYNVQDQSGEPAQASFTITVNGVNDAPSAVTTDGDFGTIAELPDGDPGENTADLTGGTVSVSFNDPDSDNPNLVVTPDAGNAPGFNVTFSTEFINNGGVGDSFDVTPTINDAQLESLGEGETVSLSFDLSIDDGNGGVVGTGTTFTVVLEGRNDAPTAVNDGPVSTSEETPVSIDVLSNDFDPDANDTFDLNFVDNGNGPELDATASNGTVTSDAVGNLIYTPNANFSGIDTVTYTIVDSFGATSSATVEVTVTSQNDAPVNAIPDGATANEDIEASILGLGVSDPDGADSILNVTLSVESGILFVSGDITGGIPPGGVIGSGTNVVVITATVEQINTTFANVEGVSYLGNENFNGLDTFTISSTDQGGLFDIDSFGINVNAVNDAPVAVDDVATTDENTTVTIDVLANDTDVDGDALTFALISGLPDVSAANGSVVVNGNGDLEYTPNAGFSGIDTITYTVTDGQDTDQGTVTVTVNAVNDAPIAADASVSGDEDNDITGQLSASDADDDPLTFALGANPGDAPQNGSVIVNPDGSFTYTPNANFNGADSFTYQVSDGNGGVDTGVVNITVDPVSDGLNAVQDNVNLTEDDVDLITGNILTNDNDPDGSAITLLAVREVLFVDSSVVTNDLFLGQPFDLDAGGSITVFADGNFEFNPVGGSATTGNFNPYDFLVSGQQLTIQLSYDIQSADGDFASADVLINITGINDAPVIIGGLQSSVQEGAQVTITFADLESEDPDDFGTELVYTVTNGPANGQLLVNGSPASSFTQDELIEDLVSYQHDGSETTTDSFEVSLADGGEDGAAPSVATFNISITPVNDAPLAADASVSGDEDMDIVGQLAATDAENDTLSFALGANPGAAPQNGSVIVNTDGSFTYTPNADFNGADSFTYQVSDGNGGVDTGVISITVGAINDAPVAADASVSGDEDNNISGQLSATDPENDALSFVLGGNPGDAPQNGSVVINTDGSFTYTPDPDFNGADSFTYQVSDGNGGVDTGVISITVNPINDAPVAVDDTATTQEDTPVVIDVLANDFDVDVGDTISIAADTGTGEPIASANNGTVTFDDASDGLLYTPNPGFSGIDTITYTIVDSNGESADATVTVNVGAVNDPPVNTVPDVQQTDEDLGITIDGLSVNDPDIGAANLTVTLSVNSGVLFISDLVSGGLFSTDIEGNGTGTVVLTGTQDQINATFGDAEGVNYEPDLNFNGTDTLTIETSDGFLTDTDTVSININPVNDAPVAADASVSGDEDNDISGQLTATDVENDTLTFALGSNTGDAPENGTVEINPDGSFTYTPNADFNGADSFTYQVSDGNGGVDTGVVNITVNAINDAPVGADASVSGDEDNNISGQLSATDADNDTLTFALGASPGDAPLNGSVIVNTDGSFTYTPDANFNGSDSFTYEVTDGNGGSDVALVNITVNPVSDAPLGTDNTITIDEDGSHTFTAADFGFTDPNDTPPDTFTAVRIVSGSGAGSLTLNGTPVTAGQVILVADIVENLLVYTPGPDESGNGLASYTFQVQDNGANPGETEDPIANTITFNVTGINDAPVGADASVTGDEDNNISGQLTATDADNDTLSFALGSSPGDAPLNGTVVINTDGSFTYTPDANFNGSDSFTYEVSDGNGGTDVALVNITVNPVSDAPLGTDNTITIDEDGSYTFLVADFGFTDPNDTPPDVFTAIRIEPASGSGTLTLAGVPITSSQVVLVADIVEGLLVYTPDPDDNGTGLATYAFQVQDNGANSGETEDPVANTITFNVNAINDAPIAVDDVASTQEDTTVTIDVLANDIDVDNDPLTFALVGGEPDVSANNGTVIVNGNGELEYTPEANFSGQDTITYTVTDGEFTDQGTVTVTVGAVNDAPVNTVPASATGDEDVQFTISGISVSDDGDPNVDILTVELSVQFGNINVATGLGGSGGVPNSGIQNNGTNSVTVTGTANQINTTFANPEGITFTSLIHVNLDQTLTVRTTDSGGLFDEDTVPIIVNPVNDGPIIVVSSLPGLYEVDEDVPLQVGGIVFQDVDAGDGGIQVTITVDSGTLQAVTVPGGVTNIQVVSATEIILSGTVVEMNATFASNTGGITFTPAADFNGDVNLSVFADDLGNTGSPGPLTASDNVTITVNSVNDAPIAVDDTASTQEDTTVIIDVLGNDIDVDNDDLTIAVLGGNPLVSAQNGTVTVNGNNELVYTPDANFTGVDTINYTVTDGTTSDQGIVSVTVGAVNDPPVNTVPDVQQTDEDLGISIDGLSVNDPDIGGANLTVTLSVNNGVLFISDIVPGGLASTDIDGNGTGTVILSGTQAQINTTFGDAEGVSYEPALNFNGTDTLTIETSDGFLTDTDTVSININPVSDAPLGTDNTITIDEDGSHTFTIADFGFTDPNDTPSDTFTAVRIVSGSGAGSLTLNGTPVTAGQVILVADIVENLLVYTPGPDDNGAGLASYTFQVQDNGANPGEIEDPIANTITFNVNAINDAPVAADASVSGDEDNDITGQLTATDADNDNLTYALGASPGDAPLNGTVVVNTDGSFTYTPDANFNGSDSFTYEVTDGNGGSDVALVNITVNSVSDAPLGTDNTITIDEDGSHTFTAADFGFTDPNDTPSDTFTAVRIVSGSGAGSLTLNGTPVTAGQVILVADIVENLLVYTPGPDDNGAGLASYTFQVQDNGANPGETEDPIANTITFNVNSINDAPETNGSTGGLNEDSGSIAISLTGTDPDGSVASFRITALPNDGVLYSDAGLNNVIVLNQVVAATNNTVNVFLEPNSNFNGVINFNYAAIDNEGLEDSTPATAVVAVNAVNDAPVLDLDLNDSSGAVGADYDGIFTENSNPVPIGDSIQSDLSISDVDDTNIESATITLTNRPDGGLESLFVDVGNLPTGITASAYDPQTGTVTLTGSASLSDYEGALENVRYANTSENPDPADRIIEVTVNDGQLDSNVAIATISVVPVNDVPIIEDLDDRIVLENTANAGLVRIDFEVSVIDIDSTDFSGGNLTVTYTSAGLSEDNLGVIPSGTPGVGINVDGTSIFLDGVRIGVITSTGVTGSDLVISFNQPGVPDAQAVEALVTSIGYSNTSDNPTLSREVSFTVNDGDGGTSIAANSTITVTPENDAPSLDLDGNDSSGATGNDYNGVFVENGGAVNIGDLPQSDISISDVDGATILSATITITNILDGSNEFLVVDSGSFINQNIVVTGNNTGTVTLTGAGTIGEYEQALENVRYNNLSENPNATDRIIEATVNDGTDDSNVATATISITQLNDAPTISITAANDLGANIVTNGGFENSPDGAGTGGVVVVFAGQTTLPNWTVDTGSIDIVTNLSAIGPVEGDRFIDLNGNAPGGVSQSLSTVVGETYYVSFLLSGDPFDGEIPGGVGNQQADVNVSINGEGQSFSFVNPPGATRADPGSVLHTFSFVATSTTSVIAFTSEDFADSNSGPYIDDVQVRQVGTQLNAGSSLVLTGLTVNDVDATDLTVTLTANSGTLNFASGADTSNLTTNTGAGTNSLQIRGPLADVQNLISNFIEYTSDAGGSGVAEITVLVEDLGQTGTGGPATATDTVFIAISPNTPPTVSDVGEKIAAPDGSLGGVFGQDFAVDANGNVYVGVLGSNLDGSASGAAYVLNPQFTGGLGISDPISGPNPGASQLFGRSVAVNDTGLTVFGQPGANSSAGEVHVLQHDGEGGLDFVATLTAPAGDNNAGDFFGRSVAINNSEVIVVTANQDDPGFPTASFPGAGALYVFTPTSPGVYGAPLKLVAPDVAAGDNLGDSVSINDAGVIVVGAVQGNGNVNNSGTAYVFEPDGSGGYNPAIELPSTSTNPNSAGSNQDFFGNSVDINNSGQIVVGAPFDGNGEGPNAGAIYVYDSPTDTNPLFIIGNEGDNFGASVAINDAGIVVVGSPATDLGFANSGAIFIYRPNGNGGFLNPIRIQPPDRAESDNFGSTVAIDNNGKIYVGSTGDDDGGSNSGSIYTYIPDGNNGYSLELSNVPVIEGDQAADTFVATTGDIGVETIVGATQDEPAIAALDNGGYVVTWVSNGQVQSRDVFAQVFDSNGNKVGGEIQVNTNTVGGQTDPSVTAVNGGFVITWNGGILGFNDDVYLQRFDNGGSPQGGETLVNDTGGVSNDLQTHIDITEIANGNLVATWESNTGDGDGTAVFARIFDPSGNATASGFVATATTIGNQSDPAVIALNTGGFAITWRGGNGNAFYQQFEEFGSTVGGELQLSSAAVSAPSVVELANGDLLAVWADATGLDTDGGGIRGLIFQNGGAVVKSEFTLNTTTTGDQSLPSVTALDDGGFFVVYRSPDADEMGVFGQRYNAAGDAVGAEIRINDVETGFQSTARENGGEIVTQLENGDIAVTFQTSATVDFTVGVDIFTRVFELPSTVDIETVDISQFITFSDPDDTPFIDEDSIFLSDNQNSDVSNIARLFNVNGTQISYDKALFDFLDDGQFALLDVTFNVVSGNDVVPRTITINVAGITDNVINIIDDTSSPVSTTAGNDGVVNGTDGQDIILGSGTTSNSFQGDQLFGLGGNDILIGEDIGSELFDGGAGDDTIITGDSNSFNGDYVIGSLGSDRINYGGNVSGYQSIAYGNLTASLIAIIVTIDVTTNTGTVQKFENLGPSTLVGTDTIIDVNNPILTGGLSIRGTQQDDVYNITSSSNGFVSLVGGQGNDTFNLESGLIRIEFRVEAQGLESFSRATEAAVVDLSLASNQISNDGFGFTDTINFTGNFASGSGNSVELRGTAFADLLIGGAGDDRFIAEGSEVDPITGRVADFIDGRGGIDLLRLDRTGAASAEIDLGATGVNGTGFFRDTIFNYEIINVENLRGSNEGVDILQGSSGDNRIEGRRSIDFINGRGGNDTLIGDSPSGASDDVDVFVFDPFNGNDTIEDFVIGQDRIQIVDSSISNTAQFDSFTFNGSDTVIGLDGGVSFITVQGVDLTTANADDIFVFNQLAGPMSGTTNFVGTANNDLIVGTTGSDNILGNDGNDIIFAGGAPDGLLDDNTFFRDGEFPGGDKIDGGAGDDLIIAEEGFNTVIGGAGDDRIQGSRIQYVGDDVSFNDFLAVDYRTSGTGITANLTSGVNGGLQSQQVSDGLGGTDTLGGVDAIIDSAFDDQIFVDGSDPTLQGSRGTRVELTGGNDTVTFLGNGGRVSYGLAEDGIDGNLTTQTVVDINLSNGDQIGTDTFLGGGATQLFGSAFDDNLIGNNLDNQFRGRGGFDMIDGGGGTNSITFFSTPARIRVDLTDADGDGFEVDQDGHGAKDDLVNIQNVFGNYSTDTLFGDANANVLNGYGSADVLAGDAGDDSLFGDSGDISRGTAGLLSGGDDLLIGEEGNDYLEGGVGADLFIINADNNDGIDNDDGFDFIQDFNLADGDRIGLTDPSITSINLGSVSYDPNFNNTFIGLGEFTGVTIGGQDLTGLTQAEIDAHFIFGIQQQNDFDLQNLSGTAGDDYLLIRPSEILNDPNNSFVFTQATDGSDTYDFTATYDDFQVLTYQNLSQAVTINIDIAGNTGDVDKGALGFDTFRNVSTPALAGGVTNTGGLDVRGTNFDDIINVTTEKASFVSVRGGAGDDTYNLDNSNQGFVRIDLRGGVTGVNVDLSLSSNQIIDDGTRFNGFVGTDTLNFTAGTDELTNTGAAPGVIGAELQIRGTDFDDIVRGGAGNESFITERGNDFFDGGAGFDRIRFDRSNTVSVDVDLAMDGVNDETASGFFEATLFSHRLLNLEHVEGSNAGVDVLRGRDDTGETIEGNGGVDVIFGRGGNDLLDGGADVDLFVYDNLTSGDDTIRDFQLGEDIIAFRNIGLTSTNDFDTFTFDGQNTLIVFGGGASSITLLGVDLVNLPNPEINFVFNEVTAFAGTTLFNGTTDNDVLVGDMVDETLLGGDGNDVIFTGGAGSGYFTPGDFVDGGAGDDLIIQQGGFSRIVGGAGNDRIQGSEIVYVNDSISFANTFTVDYSTSTSGITVNYTNFAQLGLQAYQVADGLSGIDTLGGVSNIQDSDFDDTFVVDGNDQTIRGGTGPRIVLGEGDDTVTFLGNGGRIDYVAATDAVNASLATGTATDRNLVDPGVDNIGTDMFTGATQLLGSNFDDLLTGQDGVNNRFRGRGGSDTIDGNLNSNNTVDHFNAVNRVSADLTLTSGQVINDGTGFSDTLININNIWGNLGSDVLIGDGFGNELYGYSNSDILIGNGGDDFLFGDFGDVNLGDDGIVSGGNDYLEGGTGSDNLTGGVGGDIFAFSAGDGFDFIQDFNFAEGDRIDVTSFGLSSTLDFGSSGGGITFDAGFNRTLIDFDGGGDDVSIEGRDLTTELTALELEEAFIFDVVTNATLIANFAGSASDDYIRINSAAGALNAANLSVFASGGDDIYDFTFAYDSIVRVDYLSEASPITVNINGIDNTGSVIKGAGVDSFYNVSVAMEGSFASPTGSFIFLGTGGNDTFNITTNPLQGISILGGAGVDTYNLQNEDNGDIVLNLSNSSSSTTVNLGLVSNQIIDDGFGNTETVNGPGAFTTVFGSSQVDTYTGSSKAERFFGEGGNDVINGGTGDTLLGGADNDLLNVPDLSFRLADGGTGIDALSIVGGGQVLDFSGLATETINSVERLDLGLGDNNGGGFGTSISIDENNVINFSETLDPFVNTLDDDPVGNSGNALALSNEALVISGDANDALVLASSGDNPGASWQLAGTDNGFEVYNYSDGSSTFASVAVDDDVVVTVS